MSDDLDVMIGLEIHVPLKTSQKLFCKCPTNYYEVEEPNTNTCPVCTGLPGSKPAPINEEAVKTALMVARLLDCKIVYENIFVKRKHYNYPDLPSGYQRTSEPFGVGGNLDGVGIWEIHMEEDPGRYDLKTGRVDYNRSGVPLIEIVSAPDMKTPEQAREFLKSLLGLLGYTERIIDVGGVLRADVNISIRGGAKVEIKNINSVTGAFKALKYEIIRQKNMMARGAQVTQETRMFDEANMITRSMRVKETADDYRYIPDPDIPPITFEKNFVESIMLPETPQTRMKKLVESGVRQDYAKTMVRDKSIVNMYEEASKKTEPALAAMWICEEVLKQLNYRGIRLTESKLNLEILADLLNLFESGKITDNTAKKILERIVDSGEKPSVIVEKEGLGKVSDEGALESAVDEILSENKKAVEDFRGGEKSALNFLVGQVMKQMKGRAEHKSVIKLITEKIN
ncbi:MAG TPA: Asp-tRNA(Asn)/Glu-tRNA(Gln) amidotransferase subunit GatB [Candidatus Altiarchaeales archaeon]|nr:Asp-tRNA(Asn)/Glu-tRNA(Gln) amidotransferase subunit GatB [Candidatus Altiarchaeales archaeon]